MSRAHACSVPLAAAKQDGAGLATAHQLASRRLQQMGVFGGEFEPAQLAVLAGRLAVSGRIAGGRHGLAYWWAGGLHHSTQAGKAEAPGGGVDLK